MADPDELPDDEPELLDEPDELLDDDLLDDDRLDELDAFGSQQTGRNSPSNPGPTGSGPHSYPAGQPNASSQLNPVHWYMQFPPGPQASPLLPDEPSDGVDDGWLDDDRLESLLPDELEDVLLADDDDDPLLPELEIDDRLTDDRLETLLPDEVLDPDDDDPELPDDEPLELLPLDRLLLDPDDRLDDDLLDDDRLDNDEELDDRLNDDWLGKLLGTLKIVGLIGPINGMPACGSGTCGITCHSRWISTCRWNTACSYFRNHAAVPAGGHLSDITTADHGPEEAEDGYDDGEGVANRVGLIGPMNGTPAWGSGTCGTTCQSR